MCCAYKMPAEKFTTFELANAREIVNNFVPSSMEDDVLKEDSMVFENEEEAII